MTPDVGFVPVAKKLSPHFDTLGVPIAHLAGLRCGPTLQDGHHTPGSVAGDELNPARTTLGTLEIIPR